MNSSNSLTSSYDAEYTKPSSYLDIYNQKQSFGKSSAYDHPKGKKVLNKHHKSNINVLDHKEGKGYNEDLSQSRRHFTEWMERESSCLTPRGGSPVVPVYNVADEKNVGNPSSNSSGNDVMHRVSKQLRVAPAQLRSNLRKADKDYDGKVPVKDLMKELRHQGVRMRDEHFHELVTREQDRQNPGFVDYNQFAKRVEEDRNRNQSDDSSSLSHKTNTNLHIETSSSESSSTSPREKVYATRSSTSPSTPPWSPRFQSFQQYSGRVSHNRNKGPSSILI
eukprot:gb/GECH01012098.1/.p1 GENE.gb/GECH01012098.1/~~gb/GECH01012098.1/.p1  ORF type:complete len:278 (+),score=56.83 gb/GECH01012098.1/:1-834(+)